jgi:hypothetical protein
MLVADKRAALGNVEPQSHEFRKCQHQVRPADFAIFWCLPLCYTLASAINVRAIIISHDAAWRLLVTSDMP